MSFTYENDNTIITGVIIDEAKLHGMLILIRDLNLKLISVNTKNILFICGGAFADLDKIILERTEKSGIGFGAKIYDEKNIRRWFAILFPNDYFCLRCRDGQGTERSTGCNYCISACTNF